MKLSFLKITVAVFFVVMFGCNKVHQHQISIDQFNLLDTDSILIVDVRTAEEFNAGHIPNAINIDWYDTAFLSKVKQLDQNPEIYVYCETDVRSNKAAILLSKNGYSNIINITGGYRSYTGSKKPIE